MARRPTKPANRDWIEHMRINSDYPETGCWELHGYRDKDGYGKIIDRKVGTLQSHRYAYMRLVDPQLTSDVILRHRCDNPICWNPDHLEPGTHADNTEDKVAKRRHIWGEAISTAKLNDALVVTLRKRYEAGETIASIARSYGVSFRATRAAVRRETWKHVL